MSHIALKISPSTLENFRTCYLGMYRKTLEDFIDKLDQPWVKTEAQSKGEAYHKILELGPDQFKEIYEDGKVQYRVNDPDMNIDWIFSEEQALPAIETFNGNPGLEHEVWGRLNFDMGKYTINMSLRVDALEMKRVWDFKTTSSKYNPEAKSYYESVQWPLYLKAYPQVEEFQYRVFHFVGAACKKHDFIFQKELRREQMAVDWLERLIAFAEQRDIITKLIHVTASNNESVRNRNSTQGND